MLASSRIEYCELENTGQLSFRSYEFDEIAWLRKSKNLDDDFDFSSGASRRSSFICGTYSDIKMVGWKYSSS